MKYNKTITGKKYIDQHYDTVVKLAKQTATSDALERIIEKTEKERARALEIFKANGELRVRQVGFEWTIYEPKKNTDAKIAANARYDAKSTTGVYLKLNNKTDADVLAWLAKHENKQGYIKELIRADMERSDI